MQGQKFIVLKKHIIENSTTKTKSNPLSSQPQPNLKFEYLITSLQIFNKHTQYFQKKQYEKHLIFESQHLIGMKAQYNFSKAQETKESTKIQNQNLSIISEVQGYERNPGVYVVNGATSIPDYQRVREFQETQQKELKLKNVLDPSGKLNLTNLNSKNTSLSIIDLQFEQKFLQSLKSTLQFQQLYDVFEDQVYSSKTTSQVLRFRLFPKLQLPINHHSYKTLQDYFDNHSTEVILHESKVKLPQFNKKFKKPRERRLHNKSVRDALKQRTQYMTLKDSVRSIDNVSVSGSVQGDLKVWFEKDQEGNIVNVYSNLEQIEQKQKKNLQSVMVSTDLISALSYLYYSSQPEPHNLHSIIIQPQTFTEQILPLSLHLTLFRHKPEPKKQGRRSAKFQSNQMNSILESIKMIYLHPTIKPQRRQLSVDAFIAGSMKISNKQDYGYGFQAIRLWVCRNSDYLGDREIKERDVNEELKNAAFIRKLYAEIIPLMPKTEFFEELNKIDYSHLNLLDRFMLEQIDAYILNMQHFYSQLKLKQAYEYTVDFYKNIIEEIFITSIRNRIIAFPNDKQNLSHGITIKRILQLLAVISPLFPFSSYHISKTDIMKWPKVDDRDNWYKNLLQYNALIKIRTELRNKLLINNFSHCEMVFPLSDQLAYSENDLRKFFGVDKISFKEPDVKEKKFGFQLRHNQTIGGKTKLQVYESKDHCLRCDPDSNQKEHLCNTCVTYLQTSVGKQIQFYDKRHNSLFIQEQKPDIELKKTIQNQNEKMVNEPYDKLI